MIPPPRIVFDTDTLSPRERQLVQALILTNLRVSLTFFQARGVDPTLPESQEGAAQEVLWLMSAQFPDLSFRIAG